jgi:hypothetical protein
MAETHLSREQLLELFSLRSPPKSTRFGLVWGRLFAAIPSLQSALYACNRHPTLRLCGCICGHAPNRPRRSEIRPNGSCLLRVWCPCSCSPSARDEFSKISFVVSSFGLAARLRRLRLRLRLGQQRRSTSLRPWPLFRGWPRSRWRRPSRQHQQQTRWLIRLPPSANARHSARPCSKVQNERRIREHHPLTAPNSRVCGPAADARRQQQQKQQQQQKHP